MTTAERMRWWVRPTGRGILMLLTVPALYASGVVWGLSNLLAVAVCLLVLIVVSLGIVVFASRRVAIARTMPSEHLYDGARVRIPYTPTAGADGIWPVRDVSEIVSSHGSRSEFVLNGIRPNRTTAVEFESMPRGLYDFGPTKMVRSDPLGLWSRVDWLVDVDQLAVWPRTVDVSARVVRAGLDTRPRRRRRSRQTPTGTEFRSLRGYAPGDDVRRVHWAASAKRDTLLVRETQDEDAEVRSASIVIDCRAGGYGTATDFETAVAASASLVRALVACRCEVDVVTISEPATSTPVESQRGLGAAMDILAGLSQTESLPADRAAHLVDAALDSGIAGALVACTGALGLESTLAALGGRPVGIAICAGSGAGPLRLPAATQHLPRTIVEIADVADLPAAWVSALDPRPRRTA